jgi:hypothetical protein
MEKSLGNKIPQEMVFISDGSDQKLGLIKAEVRARKDLKEMNI